MNVDDGTVSASLWGWDDGIWVVRFFLVNGPLDFFAIRDMESTVYQFPKSCHQQFRNILRGFNPLVSSVVLFPISDLDRYSCAGLFAERVLAKHFLSSQVIFVLWWIRPSAICWSSIWPELDQCSLPYYSCYPSHVFCLTQWKSHVTGWHVDIVPFSRPDKTNSQAPPLSNLIQCAIGHDNLVWSGKKQFEQYLMFSPNVKIVTWKGGDLDLFTGNVPFAIRIESYFVTIDPYWSGLTVFVKKYFGFTGSWSRWACIAALASGRYWLFMASSKETNWVEFLKASKRRHEPLSPSTLEESNNASKSFLFLKLGAHGRDAWFKCSSVMAWQLMDGIEE